MKTYKPLIIILIVALLVVYFLIGRDYLDQRNQKEALAGQIAEAASALALIPLPPADLDEQLAVAQDNLWAVQDTFIIDTNDTRIVNGILRLAEEAGVIAIPLSTQPWLLEEVLDQEYSVFRINLEVTGNYTQLVNYLNRLENSDPGTLILEQLTVEKASGGLLLENTVEGPITANIRIAIYAPPVEK